MCGWCKLAREVGQQAESQCSSMQVPHPCGVGVGAGGVGTGGLGGEGGVGVGLGGAGVSGQSLSCVHDLVQSVVHLPPVEPAG